jgi:hypothetical protein
MNAVKTEPDSDSETQSTSLKGDFEFIALNYEQDPLENTHNVPETKVRCIILVLCYNYTESQFTHCLISRYIFVWTLEVCEEVPEVSQSNCVNPCLSKESCAY